MSGISRRKIGGINGIVHMWLPSVLLVVLKIALEYKQTVFQAIRVIFIVDISRNLGESVKIKKQNKHPLQK